MSDATEIPILETVPREVWAIEVFDGVHWRRMQARYSSRACARSWLSFVKLAWFARHARTVCVRVDQVSPVSFQHPSE